MSMSGAKFGKTRAFSRVIGPLLVLFATVVELRMNDMPVIAASFFASPALVWVMGTLLGFAGMLIIANHQVWSDPAGILVSLLGWFLVIRGVTLLVAPAAYSAATARAIGSALLVRLGFAMLGLAGIYLSSVGWGRCAEA